MSEDTHEDLFYEIRSIENKMQGMSNPMKLKNCKRQLKDLNERLRKLNSKNPVKL